jgi:hypothetical protein
MNRKKQENTSGSQQAGTDSKQSSSASDTTVQSLKELADELNFSLSIEAETPLETRSRIEREEEEHSHKLHRQKSLLYFVLGAVGLGLLVSGALWAFGSPEQATAAGDFFVGSIQMIAVLVVGNRLQLPELSPD